MPTAAVTESMEHQPTTTPTSITLHALVTHSTPVLAHSRGVGRVGATVPTWLAEEEGSGRLVGRGYHIIKRPWVRRSWGLWWSCLLWCRTWHAPTRPSSSHSIADYYNKNIRLPFIYFHSIILLPLHTKALFYCICAIITFVQVTCIVFTTCANPPAHRAILYFVSYEHMLPIHLTPWSLQSQITLCCVSFVSLFHVFWLNAYVLRHSLCAIYTYTAASSPSIANNLYQLPIVTIFVPMYPTHAVAITLFIVFHTFQVIYMIFYDVHCTDTSTALHHTMRRASYFTYFFPT